MLLSLHLRQVGKLSGNQERAHDDERVHFCDTMIPHDQLTRPWKERHAWRGRCRRSTTDPVGVKRSSAYSGTEKWCRIAHLLSCCLAGRQLRYCRPAIRKQEAKNAAASHGVRGFAVQHGCCYSSRCGMAGQGRAWRGKARQTPSYSGTRNALLAIQIESRYESCF